MEKVRSQLLELVRCSSWGTEPSTSLFDKEVDWRLLLNQAQQQALLGQVYSQLEKLESRPERNTMMQLHKLTTLNRKMYLKQLQVLDTITKRLQEGGIERPVLLKGVGVSSNYHDPGVRQCGDIDLYIGKADYEKACEMAKGWSESVIESDSLSFKHYHFFFDGIPVELHRIVIQNNNIMRHSSQFSKWCIDQLEGQELRQETIEGINVYLPPYNFDAIYIFYHAWNHFCSYGIAFRQICDWCIFLDKYRDKIQQEKLVEQLKYFGLMRPWNSFGQIATTLLGLDKSAIVALEAPDQQLTDKVAERIWSGGNFGFYNGIHLGKGQSSILRRKFQNFFALFHSFAFLFTIDPIYSINFLCRAPLQSIIGNIYQQYYTRTGK